MVELSRGVVWTCAGAAELTELDESCAAGAGEVDDVAGGVVSGVAGVVVGAEEVAAGARVAAVPGQYPSDVSVCRTLVTTYLHRKQRRS